MRYLDLSDRDRAVLCDWLRSIGGDPDGTRSVRLVPGGVVVVCLLRDDDGRVKTNSARDDVLTTARFIRTTVPPPEVFHTVAVGGRVSADGR